MPLSSVAPVDPLRSTSGLWPERVTVSAGSPVTGATDPRGTARAAVRAGLAGWALAVDVLRAESPGEVSAEARGAWAAIAAPIPSATASAPR
jgi:hypothetical protein